MTMKKKYVVDLFAGCGGLSLGLERAGFHPVFVNELNKDAMASDVVPVFVALITRVSVPRGRFSDL